MGKKKDLTGLIFGRLTVLKDVGKNKNGCFLWLCSCSCGSEKIVLSQPLQDGRTRSCGCLHKEQLIQKFTTHGLSIKGKRPKCYLAWVAIKQRCYNKNNLNYDSYGGRGIQVCERWRNSFKNFYADMGDKPSKFYSLERKDNDGNYEPSNCIWATTHTQSRNKRNNIWIEHNGEKLIVADWAKRIGIPPENLTILLRRNVLSDIIIKYENRK